MLFSTTEYRGSPQRQERPGFRPTEQGLKNKHR